MFYLISTIKKPSKVKYLDAIQFGMEVCHENSHNAQMQNLIEILQNRKFGFDFGMKCEIQGFSNQC